MNPDHKPKIKSPSPTFMGFYIITKHVYYPARLQVTEIRSLNLHHMCIWHVCTNRLTSNLTHFSRSQGSRCRNQILGQPQWHKS